MPLTSPSALCRRQFLQASIACTFAVLSRPVRAYDRPIAQDSPTTTLRAGKVRVPMVGDGFPETKVWTYNSVEPGPILRVRPSS